MRLAPGREYSLKEADVVSIAQYQLLISMPEDFRQQESIESELEMTQSRIKLINATILVGDIKNFSSLMEDYAANPEQVMEATGKLFEALNREIHKQFGQLEKIAGDAIMAYWHSGRSDVEACLSAYQACLAALELKAITSSLATDGEYWPFPNHPLALDMALATGPVASGALGRTQGNPALLGDTANIAFRLEKLIGDDQAGVIVVEGTTYDLVKSRFKFSFLGEFNIKGRQRSVNVYQLLGPVEPQ
jgi:adenylate cyclase